MTKSKFDSEWTGEASIADCEIGSNNKIDPGSLDRTHWYREMARAVIHLFGNPVPDISVAGFTGTATLREP